MTIRVLAEEVASQIAAGEVIERPASVIKELLENSLDSGANEIRIRTRQSGRDLIEVMDDGCGIPSGELKTAMMRHATSKLQKTEDLFHIATLGFRGEALASIASVSRLTISTRSQNAEIGTQLRMEGGKILDESMVAMPVGTNVKVENLFFNVPPRLKFLKRDQTERQQMDHLASRYAVAYPDIRFQMLHDEKIALNTSGSGNRREAIGSVYGVEIAQQLIEIGLNDDEINIEGFTSPISLTRSNRKEITFFVNGRWVQDSTLSSALYQAYRTFLMVGRFPMALIFIQIDPELVDVNVHPAKSEVRFRQPDMVFSFVQRAVRRGLLAYSPIPLISFSTWGNHGDNPIIAQGNDRSIDPAWAMGLEAQPENQPVDGLKLKGDQDPQAPQQANIHASYLPILRLVGQVGATYIVAEGPDGLYLIDQHAAHERILFERYLNQRPGMIQSQNLIEPIHFQLPSQTADLFSQQMGLVNQLGFTVESFGMNSFMVRAIPAYMGNIDPISAVRVVVEDFEEDETPLQNDLDRRMAARICKRAAIKGGQLLSHDEQLALLRDLEACHSPRTCPHGRPTMIHLSVDILERQFGRRGSR